MRRRVKPLGRVMLLPPAAFAVHQLRYELAYGSQAGAVLRETGHSYLHSVVPWLVFLIAAAAGTFLLAVGRACAGLTSPRTFSVSFCGLWALCVVALVAVFAGQETLEGVFATGHPRGWTGVFGDGGWWAVPVAACVGFVLAAILHGARWVVRRVALRHRPPRVPRPRVAGPAHPSCPILLCAPAPLLAGWSSRGPPV